MYAFYDPNATPVPYRIMGSTYAASPSDQPGSMGGLPSVYVDDAQNPDVVANLGLYKIDPSTMTPVHLTQTEVTALNAAYVAPPPTTEDNVTALQKENTLLKTSVTSANNTISNLINYVMTLPTV